MSYDEIHCVYVRQACVVMVVVIDGPEPLPSLNIGDGQINVTFTAKFVRDDLSVEWIIGWIFELLPTPHLASYVAACSIFRLTTRERKE